LILHWNGQSWNVVPSPADSSNDAVLISVAATSRTNAWAVGDMSGRMVILHWKGQAWKIVPSPNGPYGLADVAATSASNAWAVGSNNSKTCNTCSQPVTEHWNGQSWKVVRSPTFGYTYHKGNSLLGVAATSAANAWAVGTVGNHDVIERWNGKT
jgi:hypothetical protein